ncbi:phosphonate ABC transporter substrate-binding protein [Aminobacter sp. DSM 101952]|nr:phosphonate ABC transporter, periplasmic phosphonate binding protein [Aminobacter sp. MSH1]KQU70099.1 phosphonate ABC transporter substrate-binding protein [Aminobacter sp. DSM 101952]
MGATGNLGRREFVAAALAGAATFALRDAAHAEDRTFKVGLTPVFLSNDLELLGHLKGYLSSKLGGAVELVSRRTYQEITALVVSGQIQAAWICGYPFVQFKADLDLVATPSWHGRPLYQSYLIAAEGRDVTDWTGLRGDIHAFSDPDSNSGFLVTRALLAENRLLPTQFFSRTFFTYGHRNVIRAIASGLAQSGSVDGYVWEVMKDLEPDLVNRTKIVRKSEWLGFPPFASAKSLASDPRIATLREALVSMANDPEGRKVLEMLRLDGFVVASPELYDTIAAKVDVVRQFG